MSKNEKFSVKFTPQQLAIILDNGNDPNHIAYVIFLKERGIITDAINGDSSLTQFPDSLRERFSYTSEVLMRKQIPISNLSDINSHNKGNEYRAAESTKNPADTDLVALCFETFLKLMPKGSVIPPTPASLDPMVNATTSFNISIGKNQQGKTTIKLIAQPLNNARLYSPIDGMAITRETFNITRKNGFYTMTYSHTISDNQTPYTIQVNPLDGSHRGILNRIMEYKAVAKAKIEKRGKRRGY